MAPKVTSLRKPVVEAGESKNDAFRRLAEFRVTKLLHRIEMIGNLSDRARYEYSEAELQKMFAAIVEAVKKVESRFKVKNGEQTGFQF